MKRILKISLTISLLFSTFEFVRSLSEFYILQNQTLDNAGRVGNSGSIIMLTIATLTIINSIKKENHE